MSVPKDKIEVCTDRNGEKYEKISCLLEERDDEWPYRLRTIHKNPEGTVVNRCPFCDGLISEGSWVNETCLKCGAVYFMNAWIRDI